MRPVSKKVVGPDIVVYDLGQNASIMVQVTASGPAGAQYRVKYAEAVRPDGRVLMPDPLLKAFETDVYSTVTLAGDQEREVRRPDFCFTSARYIEVEGVTVPSPTGDEAERGEATCNRPTIHSITARHVSSASRQLGFVKTDKSDVNALIKVCR